MTVEQYLDLRMIYFARRDYKHAIGDFDPVVYQRSMNRACDLMDEYQIKWKDKIEEFPVSENQWATLAFPNRRNILTNPKV